MLKISKKLVHMLRETIHNDHFPYKNKQNNSQKLYAQDIIQ